jgi:hypothetical protein
MQCSAAAIRRCMSRVFTNPMSRARRRSPVRVPWARVPSTPARRASAFLKASVCGRARAAWRPVSWSRARIRKARGAVAARVHSARLAQAAPRAYGRRSGPWHGRGAPVVPSTPRAAALAGRWRVWPPRRSQRWPRRSRSWPAPANAGRPPPDPSGLSRARCDSSGDGRRRHRPHRPAVPAASADGRPGAPECWVVWHHRRWGPGWSSQQCSGWVSRRHRVRCPAPDRLSMPSAAVCQNGLPGHQGS